MTTPEQLREEREHALNALEKLKMTYSPATYQGIGDKIYLAEEIAIHNKAIDRAIAAITPKDISVSKD